MRICRKWLLLWLVLSLHSAWAQVCSAPGFDGPNASLTGVVNTYHAGSGSTSGSQVTVASISGQGTNNRSLIAGDLVLIMQMQDSVTPANAGLYEYAQILSISGTVLTLNRPLTNTYVQNVSAAGGVTSTWRTFQVVRVPQYSSATVPVGNTLSADRWTVSTTNGQGYGGVVAMDVAGSLAVNGTISADGSGFRGGAAVNGTGNRAGGLFSDLNYNFDPTAANGAVKGEGNVGTPFQIFNGTATVLAYSTATFGQGYAAGAAGQAAQGTAGGGANDGLPATGGNQYNAGGGGGANQGAGGQGGKSWSQQNDAGGRGGGNLSNGVTLAALGGGGGAGGTNNNGVTNAITTWPPNLTGTRSAPPGTGTIDGAAGPISGSGASGGGVILLRAGILAASSGSISAQGYTAFNMNGGSEASGGGGAGGTIIMLAGSGTGAGLSLNASGGGGGFSNYYDHGPGGGGGGGYILTSSALLAQPATTVAGGGNGYDACCGGGSNGVTKANGAVAGSAGAVGTTASSAPGEAAGAVCMPVLATTKTTLTPLLIVPAATTATYVINVRNATTAGAAYGVAINDVLPAPLGLATTATAATATYAGTNTTGPSPSTANRSGVTPTAVFGVAGTGNNPTTPSFTIYPGGSVTLTFVVNLNTSTIATFQNSATIAFMDPTRTTGGAATASTVVSPTVSPGGTYASGTAVGGSNYASASSPGEDVRLINGTTSLTISKTNGVNSLVAGSTTSYTITVANLGPTAAPGTTLTDPAAAGLNCTTVTCSSTAVNMCPVGPTVGALQSTGLQVTPTFPANSTASFVVTCGVTATGQ